MYNLKYIKIHTVTFKAFLARNIFKAAPVVAVFVIVAAGVSASTVKFTQPDLLLVEPPQFQFILAQLAIVLPVLTVAPPCAGLIRVPMILGLVVAEKPTGIVPN